MKLAIITTVLCLASLSALGLETSSAGWQDAPKIACDIEVNDLCFNGLKDHALTIDKNGIFVDGNPLYEYLETARMINITVNGNVGAVTTKSGTITVNGDVLNGITTGGGDVTVKGNAIGNIQSGGGNISTSSVCNGTVLDFRK